MLFSNFNMSHIDKKINMLTIYVLQAAALVNSHVTLTDAYWNLKDATFRKIAKMVVTNMTVIIQVSIGIFYNTIFFIIIIYLRMNRRDSYLFVSYLFNIFWDKWS